MTTTFPVDCRRIFKSLSIFMPLAIIVAVTFNVGIRYVSSGFDYAKTFEHMSPLVFVIIILCVPIVTTGFAFLVSLWFRLATITISDEAIHGRSYWGRKNKIPLNDITKLVPFSNNGIKAIVVYSKYHGQVYISDKRLSENYLTRNPGEHPLAHG